MTLELPEQPKNTGRRRALGVLAFVVITALLVVVGRWFVHGRHHVTTDDASVAGDIVLVTPQVPGTVARIAVEDTMAVKAGDVLVELDATDLKMNRERAEATLLSTVREVRAQYAQTQSAAADAASAQAELSLAQIESDQAIADLKRRQAAAADGGVMGEELAHAEASHRSAEARVVAASRRADAAQARARAQSAITVGVDVLHHPRIVAAASALRTALINESRAQIRAPIDGQVARRAVTTGALVSPGTPILSIVPLHSVWVDANFKEAQLTDVRVGQAVEMTSDLYGTAVKFHGRVAGLDAGTGSAFSLLPAQNATGNWIKVVQRVPVRVDLDPKELAEHPLRVGLSMAADIDTQDTATAAPVVTPTAAAAGYAAAEAAADAAVAALLSSALADAREPTPRHGHRHAHEGSTR
jgi:membrane fusion protein (multidrug efflux system)